MGNTTIAWTDVTDNIIVAEGGGWWCRMISEGCVNCYAAKLNQSDYFGGNHLPYTGDPPKLKLRTDIIDGWQRQSKPKKHFVASMTDIFGDWVPINWAYEFLDGMREAPKQTFQLLTKRADVAKDYITQWLFSRGLSQLPSNMWIGVSVENQKRADERIPLLLQIPAKVRFLSVEPMLEAIEFSDVTNRSDAVSQLGKKALAGIHWCIFGGESGPGARPCNVEWIRDGVRQCKAAEIQPFVKQLGAHVLAEDSDTAWVDWKNRDCKTGLITAKLNDKKGGDWNEWPMDLRIRNFPV